MTIVETIREALRYAWHCKSLWVFGFFVGISSGGSGGAGNGGGSGGGTPAAGLPFGLTGPRLALIVAALVLIAVVGIVVRFLSEGALIEGIVRARRGETVTTREGFRGGLAHWGVLLRIGLLYFAAIAGTFVVLGIPCALALRALGWIGGLFFIIPGLAIAVPWLVTLHLVQAFASRIAVLENRRAIDAIGKARLFLHGRILHGLKLAVAAFIATLGIMIPTLAMAIPVVLLLVAAGFVVGLVPAILIGCVLLIPAFCVVTAFVGTLRSSIWTIGYLTQVES